VRNVVKKVWLSLIIALCVNGFVYLFYSYVFIGYARSLEKDPLDLVEFYEAAVNPMEIKTASFYSNEEYPNSLMANGEVFDDEKFTCASWDYNFGTLLRVTNKKNDRSVRVRVTDRGPSKELYRMGRVIDLSAGAFSEIADLEQGIANISIKVIE